MDKERERTGFTDRHSGREILVGDVVRASIEYAFSDVHGTWAEYEIVKVAGGYALYYVTSEKGCIFPFGYTAAFMHDFGGDDGPDPKSVLWSDGRPVEHPLLQIVDDGMTAKQRRNRFMTEFKQGVHGRV